MPVPRFFATGLWAAVTAASTAMVWAATSNVAADVTDRPPPVVAHRDVVSQLQSAPPASTTTTLARPSTTAASGRGRTGAPADPGSPVTTAPPAESPPPAAPTSPTTVGATSPPTRAASPPTTQAAPRSTATYSTIGGVVRVACNGFLIQLLSATPTDGYAATVVAGGPANVDVRFTAPGQEFSVRAVCFGQPIRYYDQTPPRQAPGSS